MGILLTALALGIVTGMIARSKGCSFLGWFLYGTLLATVVIPHALITKSNSIVVEQRRLEAGDEKKCPKCAEMVRAEVVILRSGTRVYGRYAC